MAKKTRPANWGPRCSFAAVYWFLATSGVALGCLERIDLTVAVFLLFLFNVSGQIAVSLAPLGLGVREGTAEAALFPFDDAVATLAGFHDGVTLAAVKRTAFLAHEGAINARFYACAVHGRNPPAWIKLNKLVFI